MKYQSLLGTIPPISPYSIVIINDFLSGNIMIHFHAHGFGALTKTRPIPPCLWDCFDLLCIHEGRLQLTIEHHDTVILEPASCLLIYPLTLFQGRPTTARCRISVQHFSIAPDVPTNLLPGPFQSLVDQTHGYKKYILKHNTIHMEDIERAIKLSFEHQLKHQHDLRVAQLTLILGLLDTIKATYAESDVDERWQKLIEWLNSRLHLTTSVESMAAYCEYSTSHFRARFRKIFGQSPSHYMQRIRMLEAERLLRETDATIKAVARMVSYDDLPNFYRAFRQISGCTPSQYRKRYTLTPGYYSKASSDGDERRGRRPTNKDMA